MREKARRAVEDARTRRTRRTHKLRKAWEATAARSRISEQPPNAAPRPTPVWRRKRGNETSSTQGGENNNDSCAGKERTREPKPIRLVDTGGCGGTMTWQDRVSRERLEKATCREGDDSPVNELTIEASSGYPEKAREILRETGAGPIL